MEVNTEISVSISGKRFTLLVFIFHWSPAATVDLQVSRIAPKWSTTNSLGTLFLNRRRIRGPQCKIGPSPLRTTFFSVP